MFLNFYPHYCPIAEKNARSKFIKILQSALLSELQRNDEDHIVDRSRPNLVLPPGPPLPQNVVAEKNREPIEALKFILNIFVDKKQVPILRSKRSSSYGWGGESVILFFVKMNVLAEKRKEVWQTINSLSADIKKEQGHVDSGFFQNATDENEILYLTTWTVRNALEA